MFRFGALRTAVAAASLAAICSAAPSGAQMPRHGAGFTLGASHIQSLNSGASPAAGTPVDLEPGTGFLVGLHFDQWYRPDQRIGLRFQGSYQQPELTWISGERDINVFTADVSMLARPLAPRPDDRYRAFLSVGLGGVWYDMGSGPETSFDPADAYYDGSSRIMPAVLAGMGVDLLLPPEVSWAGNPVWVRIEAADELTFNSPLKQLSTRSRYGEVHHLRLSIGAYSAVSLLGD